MRAALWIKLKCAGPILDLETEARRFLFWLPPRLRPLLVNFRTWQQRYRQTASVVGRLEVERQALKEMRRLVRRLPEQRLCDEFFDRADEALKRSTDARRSALEGKAVEADLDGLLYRDLLDWLAGYQQGPQREIASWLARMLRAWWAERGTVIKINR